MHGYRADYMASEGEDPLPWWDLAIAAYQRCVAIQPDHPTALARWAAVHAARAAHRREQGADPGADLDAAVRTIAGTARSMGLEVEGA